MELVLSSGRVLAIQYSLTFGDLFIIILLLALTCLQVARLAMRK